MNKPLQTLAIGLVSLFFCLNTITATPIFKLKPHNDDICLSFINYKANFNIIPFKKIPCTLSASITTDASSVCSGNPATLTAVATDGTPDYHFAWSTGDTTASITVNPSTNTTYSVTITDANGCISNAQKDILIQAAPLATFIGLNTAYCKNEPSVALATSATGGSFVIDGVSSVNFDPSVLSVGNHIVSYNYMDLNGCSNSINQTVEVKSIPSTPFSVHFADCGSTRPKAHAVPYGFGQEFEWYPNADRTGGMIPDTMVVDAGVTTGETSILKNNVFNTGSTVLNTSYYVFEKSTNGCYSEPREVPITVFPLPQQTPVITSSNFGCGDSIVITANGHGNIVLWRDDFRSTFGSTLGSGNSYTARNSQSIWVSESTQNTFQGNTFTCYGAPIPLNIILNPTPPAPTISDISLCVGDAPKPIFTNPDYRWYTLPTGDFQRYPPDTVNTAFANVKTYYVSQIVNLCESPRVQLNTVVHAIPPAPSVFDVQYCQSEVATVLTAGGINLKWYDANNTLLNAAPTPSTSIAGDTTYYVSQVSNNCESPKAVIHVTVKEAPSTPSVSSITQPTCSISTGTISLTTQTGVEYSFDNGLTYQASNIKSGLSSGVYSIKVKNASGCESSVLTVTINAAPSSPITPSVLSVTQPTCSVSTGTITLTTQTGVEYSFDNGLTYQSSNVKSGLNSGLYSIKVKNAEGCESSVLTVTINAAPSSPILPAISSVTQPTCSVSTGTIALTTQTGVEYSFDNGLTYQALNVKSALTSGIYLVKVKNLEGCESNVLTVTINDAPSSPILPTISSITQPTCSVSTGTIMLITQTGVEYSFDNGLTYQASNVKSGLNSGLYYIKVKNAEDCESSVLTVTINAAPSSPILPTISSITQPTCSVSTGTISLTTQTGVEYSFDNGLTYQSSNVKSGLPSGVYSVKVKNIEGCESSVLTVTIDAAPSSPITPSVSSVTQPTCSVSTGTITLTTQTGVEYSFDNGLTYQSSNIKSGLTSGVYSVKVKNLEGCESSALTVTINAAPSSPILPTISSVTQPTCSVSTGTITLTTQTGVEYSFDNGLTYQSSNIKSGLSSGIYSIKVKNASGCESSVLTVTINAAPSSPILPTISSVTQPTCSISTGTITLTTQTGVEYSFDNGLTYQVSNVKSGLPSGVYSVKVKNASGCESSVLAVTINAVPSSPSTPSVSSVTQPTCNISTGIITLTTQTGVEYSFDNGLTYQASNVKSGLPSGVYSIKVKNASGCESSVLTVTINAAPSSPSTPSVLSVTQPTCSVSMGTITLTTQTGVEYSFDNGLTYQSSNVKSGLIAGTYKIRVKNSGGCVSASIDVVINVAPLSLNAPTVTLTQPTCLNPMGTITVSNAGSGTQYSFDNGLTYQASNVKSGLVAGTYKIKVKNISGCESAVTNAVLLSPSNPTVYTILASKDTVCKGETVKLTALPFNYTNFYKWNTGATGIVTYVSPNANTSYSVTVIYGSCTSVISKAVYVYPKLPVPTVTVVQPTCDALGSITITNLPSGTFSKINGAQWTINKTVYNNLESGTYKVKIKDKNCDYEQEIEVTLNNPTLIIDPNKCYKIVNKNSGKVIDLASIASQWGMKPFVQTTFNNKSSQKWQFSRLTNGNLRIKSSSSNNIIAIIANYYSTNVLQIDASATGYKDWRIECIGQGNFIIYNPYIEKCLGVEGNSKAENAKIEARNWSNIESQKWQLVEVPCANTSNLRQAGYMNAKADAELDKINFTWYSNMGYKTDFYSVEKFDAAKGDFAEVKAVNNTQFDDEMHDFTYSDAQPTEGDNIYRVKAVFNDGTVELSQNVKVAFGNVKDVRLFPNPAVDYIDVLLNEIPKGVVKLTLNNMLGMPVAEMTAENEQKLYFDIGTIPNGIYQLHIVRKGKRSMVKQVVIQR